MSDKTERDRLLVGEMLAHLDMMASLVARGKAHFVSEEGMESRYAANSAIELFVEASSKVSAPFKDANPKLPWETFRPLGKGIAHPYGGATVLRVDLDILWNFLDRDAPKFRRALERPKFP